MLADDEFYETLLAFEEELIDEYVRGELLGRKRKRFEKLYLDAPRRRRQIEFARTLRRALAASTVTAPKVGRWDSAFGFVRDRRPAIRLALAAAIVAVAVAGIWLSSRRQTPSERAGGSAVPRERLQGRIATLVLYPGRLRAAGAQPKLTLAPDTASVEFRLEGVEAPYASYRARLETVEGQVVQDLLEVAPAVSGLAVIVRLSADTLHDRDYILFLSGVSASQEVEEIGGYSFSVVKGPGTPPGFL